MQKRCAFSLIELLIVILIIGVVYTLAISNFQKLEDGTTNINLQTLKKFLHSIPHEKNVKLLCLDECSSCDIFVDGKKSKEYKGIFDDFLDKNVKVYKYDFSLGYVEHQHQVYFNSEDVEEDVCFSYSIDKKGIGEQVLVEYDESVYDFSPYIDEVQRYDSLHDATENRQNFQQEILR